VPQVWRMTSAQALFDTVLNSTVRTAALLRAQRPEALAHIQAAVQDAAERFHVWEGIELPMPSVLASAVKR
jgi:hypothetical protein